MESAMSFGPLAYMAYVVSILEKSMVGEIILNTRTPNSRIKRQMSGVESSMGGVAFDTKMEMGSRTLFLYSFEGSSSGSWQTRRCEWLCRHIVYKSLQS